MKIIFIVNKGRRDRGPDEALLTQFKALLDNATADYELILSASVEETETALTKAMEAPFDQLWIGGGDGTINHALNFTFGRPIAYGIVPMGTVNALAQALRIPLEPVEAVKYLLKSRPIPMDIGMAADRYFFTYATVGMHAAVFHNINKDLKKRWGRLAFWESAARTIWQKSRLPRFLLEMELADKPKGQHVMRDYGYSFTLSNLANYAGFGTLTAEDPASPGYFELTSFRRNRLMPMLVWFTLLRIIGIDKSRPESGQMFRRVRWVKVRSNHKISVQIDGEPIKPEDRKNMEIRCLDDAVKILLCPTEAGNLRGNPNPQDE